MSDIRKEYQREPVLVNRVYKSKYQKNGSLTAELTQKVTTLTYYPTSQINNGLGDNLFADTEFDLGSQEPYEKVEVRYAWIDIPDTSGVEDLQERLKKCPNACIQKITSSTPILDENQEENIAKGILDKDRVADKQVVKYGDNHKQKGEYILKNGFPIYKRNNFFTNIVEDESNITDEHYLSETMQIILQPDEKVADILDDLPF